MLKLLIVLKSMKLKMQSYLLKRLGIRILKCINQKRKNRLRSQYLGDNYQDNQMNKIRVNNLKQMVKLMINV